MSQVSAARRTFAPILGDVVSSSGSPCVVILFRNLTTESRSQGGSVLF